MWEITKNDINIYIYIYIYAKNPINIASGDFFFFFWLKVSDMEEGGNGCIFQK